MRNIWLITGIILVMVAMTISAAPRPILVNVSSVPLAWSDSDLKGRVVSALSRHQEFRVYADLEKVAGNPPFPETRTDTDSLVNWGVELGGHYLMVITVNREGLERKKTFSIPLIFHKYETVGVIEGELRFIDLSRGRLLVAEPFLLEKRGAQQFQAEWDDNRSDPTLHLNPSEKSKLFAQLEEELANKLTKRVQRLISGK